MKALVLGATGGTGREIVAQALDAGYEVRVLCRNPDAVGAWSPRLEVVQGDVSEWRRIAGAMRGVTAVLSVLGTRGKVSPTTLYSEGTGAILWAMAEAGVRRLVCVTSSGTIEDPDEPFLFRTAGRYVMRHVIADQKKAEERLRASDAEWTIVRPSRLINGPRRGDYEVLAEEPVPGEYKLSRSDLAQFMLREMVAKKYLKAAVGIGYPGRRARASQPEDEGETR
jgi:uncharacterized protein YbjT (DUF2867 family)